MKRRIECETNPSYTTVRPQRTCVDYDNVSMTLPHH